MEFRAGRDLPFERLLDLYNSVGWVAYIHRQQRANLQKAICNSTYVISAWHGDTLVGLARCLSDDVSIFYLQDILVRPEFQRQGVGRQLLQNCLERFKHVRMKVLLTDDEEGQVQFYESLGYRNTKYLSQVQLNTFVQIEGVDLG